MATLAPSRPFSESETPNDSMGQINTAECLNCGSRYGSHYVVERNGQPNMYCHLKQVSGDAFKFAFPEQWRPFIVNALKKFTECNRYPCNSAALKAGLANVTSAVCSDYD